MSYLGLVPSEQSSGQARRQGKITKTGSRHARRLLVEAAWHYRRPPRRAPRSSAARKASPLMRSRSPGRPSSASTTSGGASTASVGSARRSSRSPSPVTSPASAGRSPPATRTLDRHTHTTARLRKRQNQPGTHAREHPRSSYEQPPRRPRSILDSGLSRRNPVLRYPTRVYQSDQASCTRQACRSLSRATDEIRPQPLTSRSPYQEGR